MIAAVDDLFSDAGVVVNNFQCQGRRKGKVLCAHQSFALKSGPDAPLEQAGWVLRQPHTVNDVEMIHMGAWNLVDPYPALSLNGFSNTDKRKPLQD